MIQSLHIQNFQSHKKSLLEFSTGVNVIVGGSDCGKSAILRALRLVAYNKPSGDAFRSHWGGETNVQVDLKEGDSIQRVKTDSSNTYVLNGAQLKAFGQGVPDEISSVLNIDEINFQQQHDNSFLLSQTAGEVSNHFNRIANIEIINKSLSKAKQEVSKVTQTVKQREEDLKEKQEQYKQYTNLEEIEVKLNVLENLDKKKQQLQVSVIQITKKEKRYSEINEELSEIKETIKLEPLVSSILEKDELQKQKTGQFQKLTTLLSKVRATEKSLSEIDVIMKLEPFVNTLLEKSKLLTTNKADLKALNVLVSKHTTLVKKGQINAEKLAKLQNKLPDTCPVCNGTGKLK
jgi:exonuclease SbcC